jgi:hypothetical protein
MNGCHRERRCSFMFDMQHERETFEVRLREDATMITEDRLAVERLLQLPTSEGERRYSDQRPQPPPKSTESSLLWRLILVLVGFGIATVGWLLVLTVFLSFIGLPMFIFGLALMQAQER